VLFVKRDAVNIWLILRGLIVKATVMNVLDWAVKRSREEHNNDTGIYFYDFDEPMGHSLAADDIYNSIEDAIKAFKSIHTKEDWDAFRNSSYDKKYTLNDYRREVLASLYCEAGHWPVGKRRRWCAKNFPRKGKRSWINATTLEY
jgi:hypothetical protein